MSARQPPSEHQDSLPTSGGSNGSSDEDLMRNMLALDAGLRQIEQEFGAQVMLAYEDPLTFGAGHFVLYPQEGSSPRFAIEEHYTGTDWSDDDRVPTSWTWVAEARLPQPDGSHPWVPLAEGEVTSTNYADLLQLAQGWAKTVHDLAVREEALTPEPVAGMGMVRADQRRTFLT